MTQEEQDAILGRTLREYNDCCRQIGAAETALSKIGETLSNLGYRLKHRPEHTTFANRERDARFGGTAGQPTSETQIFQIEAINGADIATRVTELQTMHMKRDDLARRLESLGHRVSQK
jgi:hypothetical protein